MISLIDYGRGNIYSITNALKFLRVPYRLVRNPESLEVSKKIILPGVGAFKDAMDQLNKRDLIEPIKNNVMKGTPILGICLGMQLFASKSYEFGETSGLGFISGEVKKIPKGKKDKIPNVGWRSLFPNKYNTDSYINYEKMMYFVHSYGFYPVNKKHIIAYTEFNYTEIPILVRKDNIIGCQFHPEKSGKNGLEFLNYFCKNL
jgi:imidazole glycerol-phosphate synthase subunit HisH